MSLFFGLQTALSGLRAQQFAMDVTAHNIANAGTEGYRRQEAVLQPGMAVNTSFSIDGAGSPKIGSGVQITSIRRMQADFIDGQVRTANQSIGSWDKKNEALKQIEAVLGEPGDNGLSSVLDKFWNSWQELATSPESLPAKASVVESGNQVAQRIGSLYGDLRSIQFQLDSQIADNAAQINQIAHEIAGLNESISKSVTGGYQPNDLMDRRDILMDQLSKIVKFQVNGQGGAEMMLTINGKTLVQGTNVTEVTVSEGANQWSQLSWADDGSALKPTGGELAGQIETRDVLVESYIDKLNTIAGALAAKVNSVHSAGQTTGGQPAGDFFTGTDAASIAVSQNLQDSPALVATSYTGRAGDNGLAQQIADLKDQKFVGGLTVNDAYGGFVAQIGTDSREAGSRVDVHNLSLQQLTTQRDSVSGVSLDEEMINMVRFQQAYNASARMVTVMDEMLDTVVNKLGIAGR